MKYKAIIYFDSSNLGVVNRLVEDGIIKKITFEPIEQQQQTDPRQFVNDVRAGRNGTEARTKPVLPAVDCIVAIMQSKPNDVWNYQDIGITLEADYQLQRATTSSTLSLLKKAGFVLNVSPGNFMLTDLGKEHNQNEHIVVKR